MEPISRSSASTWSGYGCTTCIGNSGPLPEDVAQGDHRGRPGGRGGPLRQPQLRGPRQPARQGQLPGLAAAGRRVRARRHGRHRPRAPSRSGTDHDGKPVFLKDIWPTQRRRSQTAMAEAIDAGDVQAAVRQRLRRRRERGTPSQVPEASCSSGTTTPPTSRSRRSSTDLHADARAAEADIDGARVLALLGDSRHHRPHLPGRQHREGQPGGQVPDGARRRPVGLQLATAPAAATTR